MMSFGRFDAAANFVFHQVQSVNSSACMSLRSTPLYHGQIYHLRTHQTRVEQLCSGFPQLVEFLELAHTNCPTDPFFHGPRSSSIHAGPQPQYEDVPGHQRCGQSEQGLEQNRHRFREAHEQVQMFMLEHCEATIAMEVPLWATQAEAGPFAAIMQPNEWLSGHVDVLAVEDQRIWIWDYKPGAHKERWVHVQLLAYAVMLSRRTGIDLNRIRCGFFDQYLCRTFAPSEQLLQLLDFYSFVPSGQSRQTLLQPKPSRRDMPTVVFEGHEHRFVTPAVPPSPPQQPAVRKRPRPESGRRENLFRVIKDGELTSFARLGLEVPDSHLNPSILYSWHQFHHAGKSLQTIATARQMAQSTIGKHLLEAAAAGLTTYDRLVSSDAVQTICHAVNQLDDSAGGYLKPVFVALNEQYSYLEIEAALVLGERQQEIHHPLYRNRRAG